MPHYDYIKAAKQLLHDSFVTASWTNTLVQMEVTKIILLLSYACQCWASHSSHTYPVEGYATELQALGQHVEIPETPVKVVKITKTVAVKIPVPYPVKVIEKIPYPVHINKPYPVPVPQIVKVPYAVHKDEHEALGAGHGVDGNNQHNQYQGGGQINHPYQVQESHNDLPAEGGHYNGEDNFGQNFGGIGDGHSSGNTYDESPNSYYGYSDDHDRSGSVESRNYDQAINDYLQRHNSHGNSHH